MSSDYVGSFGGVFGAAPALLLAEVDPNGDQEMPPAKKPSDFTEMQFTLEDSAEPTTKLADNGISMRSGPVALVPRSFSILSRASNSGFKTDIEPACS